MSRRMVLVGVVVLHYTTCLVKMALYRMSVIVGALFLHWLCHAFVLQRLYLSIWIKNILYKSKIKRPPRYLSTSSPTHDITLGQRPQVSLLILNNGQAHNTSCYRHWLWSYGWSQSWSWSSGGPWRSEGEIVTLSWPKRSCLCCRGYCRFNRRRRRWSSSWNT